MAPSSSRNLVPELLQGFSAVPRSRVRKVREEILFEIRVSYMEGDTVTFTVFLEWTPVFHNLVVFNFSGVVGCTIMFSAWQL